jgi:hypothetical protein
MIFYLGECVDGDRRAHGGHHDAVTLVKALMVTGGPLVVIMMQLPW